MTLPFERDQRRVQKVTFEFIQPQCDVWNEHRSTKPSHQNRQTRTLQVSIWSGRACDSPDKPMKLEGVYQSEHPAGRPLKRAAEIMMECIDHLHEEQEDLEADAFNDLLHYRRRGLPLTELILADLDAHESYVDGILESAADRHKNKEN